MIFLRFMIFETYQSVSFLLQHCINFSGNVSKNIPVVPKIRATISPCGIILAFLTASITTSKGGYVLATATV